MVSALLVLVLPFTAFAANKDFRSSEASGHLAKPAVVDFSPETLSHLKVPKGFKVSVFAKDLGDPRMMVISPDGRVFVSRPKEGEIVALKDTNGDGVADEKQVIVSGQKRPHGMALHDGLLYFVAMQTVFTVKPEPGATPKAIIENLPSVGQHKNRSLAIGPDNKLYVAIASTCNNCDDPTEGVASMLRFDLDGKNRETFARGLRDTIGFDWQPESKELYGMDHGVDWHGDEMPPEELNHLEQGKHYGWPFCYHTQIPDDNLIDDPEGKTKKEFCRETQNPVLSYSAHAAPIAMKFYTGAMFPAEYRNGAFVAFHGSWNRQKPVGYNVERVIFADGKPKKFEDFLTGFASADGRKQYGRPTGLAVMNDGSLLVSEDSAGVIYRITYAK